MKYLMIICLIMSCNVRYALYDEPIVVSDIINHGLHCPCREKMIKGFSMTIKTKDTTYPTQHVRGDNIPMEYRTWMDTNYVCLEGCVIHMDNIIFNDTQNNVPIKRKYYIKVIGLDVD